MSLPGNTGSLSAYNVGTKGTHLLWVNQINQNIQSAPLAEFAPGININQFRPYKAIRALAWYRHRLTENYAQPQLLGVLGLR